MPESSAPNRFRSTPLRDLKLTIEGTPLEPTLKQFDAELVARGIPIQPHYYLSTDWGVPFPSISIGIPFYLAHPDLIELHGQQVGHLEGSSGPAELLQYMRHEMGHVVNYAFHLYDEEDWVKLFGSMTQPYLEEYRPSPFSRRYVRHLPGWYAQKHPDEDWAETFAVWMTPGDAWRQDYKDWPKARAKLEYCDRTIASLKNRKPVVTARDYDEDASTLALTAEDFYRDSAPPDEPLPEGVAGALRSIFFEPGEAKAADVRPASELINRLKNSIAADVFRWTGHFPERTHALLRDMARRCDELHQVIPKSREMDATVNLTTLVTALAMNYVHNGSYFG
jgi:hypothetical protein